MKKYVKNTAAVTLALALAAAGTGTAFADVIVAGQSRQDESQVTGPGAVSAGQSQSPAQQVAPGGSAPGGTSSGSAAPGESSSEASVSGGSQTVVQPATNYPVVDTSPAVGAVEGAVTVSADYGVNGEILRLSMQLNGIEGTITYGVYVNNGGFLPWQADGTMNGGTEESTHVEAIQVALTGEAAKHYNVYYRGTSALAGNHGWACNEELMGTIDRGDYLKKVEVVLLPKDAGAPGSYEGRFYSNHSESIRIADGNTTYANGYTGWVDHDRARYYFVNGAALTGWQYVDGLKFYFNNSGQMVMDVDGLIGKQDSYVLKVNKELNCLTVYAKDGDNGYIIPVKAMLTSVGDDTPLGTFYTPEKYRWRFMVNSTYTQYATRLTAGKGFLFHSITYEKTDPMTLITDGYNKLGVSRSLGCIRLTCANAKWVYDNCKLNTQVVVYEDASTPGPFFKPYHLWIPADQTWDPSDPAAEGL